MTERRKYATHRHYLIMPVQRRRHQVRMKAVSYKGGRCQLCGYCRCIEALELHHLDPEHKDFSISGKGYTRSWKRVKEELDKCCLLCANCHREVHAGLQLPRETVAEKPGEFREACPAAIGV